MDPFTLSTELVNKIEAVKLGLEDELSDLRDQFNEKSERWQESNRGCDVECWLEEIDNLIYALDNFYSVPQVS